MNHPKMRHWALISHGAEAGKSTFLGTNARRPLYCVDTDGRFEAVEGLGGGEVIYPKQVIDPLVLTEEILDSYTAKPFKGLAWDSLTKLYSMHARLGFMRARAGRSKNRAAEMIDKSNAMTMARDIGAMLRVDAYYTWHTTAGIDGAGNAEIRDMISSVERERLMTSINIILEFVVENSRYGIKVARARGFNGLPANTGFTIWDEPGNFWRGGGERLERLIYTSFVKKEDAIKWAGKELGLDFDEAEGEYEHRKEGWRPGSSGEMFALWVEYVDETVSVGKMVKEPASPQTTQISAQDSPLAEIGTETPVAQETSQEAEISTVEAIRATLVGHGDLLSLGHIVFAAALAWDDKYTAETALTKVKEYPDLPDGIEIRMDRLVSQDTGHKVFDWLGEVE